jgi:hypothetical protein
MMRVTPPAEPANFDHDCRQPGNTWLAAHPNAPPPSLPDHWRLFIPELCAGFENRCGYLAMWDMNGTVDHFLSMYTHQHLAYEWSNYRYLTGWVNSSKQAIDELILDPFRVRDEWFEIDLPSLHLRLTQAVPPRFRARAAFTISRLRLDYGPRVIQQRQTYYGLFQAGQMTIGQLEIMAPLLATAIRRKWVVNHLTNNPPVSQQQAAVICQVTVAQVRPLLRVWTHAGHLVVQGRGRNVGYRL